MSPVDRSYHAVVPAGGVGTRFGSITPKQYLPMAGRSVLEWTLASLSRAAWLRTILVVVAADDAWIGRLPLARLDEGTARIRIARVGGPTRRDSVFNGLCWLRDHATPADRDFVLVHDAARPGIDAASLERLRTVLSEDPVGGLLAMPVVDTVKRADPAARVAATVSRAHLWLAQTPQMFRFATLLSALERHPDVTDEAAAIEAEGLAPRLVEGSADNFKVTTPDDLTRMEEVLLRHTPAASESATATMPGPGRDTMPR